MTSPASALLAAIALFLAACATAEQPAIDQRTSQGPTARQFWTLRMMSNNREPTLDERRHFEDQLDLRISEYLAKHPEDANSLQVSSFRFDRRAVTGMSKEQVLILLGAPVSLTLDQAEMAKLARRYWPEMQGNVTEAWVYPLGWSFFFAGPRLVEITQYLPKN